jgi:Ca2+-binding EF-hand superfamily protein
MTHKTISRSLTAAMAAALAIGALAASAHATEPGARHGGGQGMLQHFDADGDGAISLPEFQAAGEQMFSKLDADSDGQLSAEERASARHSWKSKRGDEGRRELHKARREEHFAKIDTDGDGAISKAEFEAARTTRFNALDANGNSVIDAAELPTREGHHMGYGKRGPASDL